MKKLDEITIADLMPDSISGDREVSATARAIDPQLKAVSEGVDLPLILASIDTLSAGVLEHLAAQYDLTAWDSAWPIDTKRAVLKTAIADKRKKGTRGAVQRAIEAVAPLATITEWWQKTPKGAPHTFEIDVLQDGEAVDAETVADVIAQVNDSKPVRSHFTFSVGQQSEGNMYLSGVIRTIAYARVRSSGMTAVQTEIDAGVLAALRGMNIRRIIEFSHMGEMPEPTPPAPALPTVTRKSAQPFPYSSYISLSAGSESDLYVYESGSYRALVYDSNNLYSIYGCYSDKYYGGQGWIRGVLFDTVISQNLLKAKNITDSTIPYIVYFSVAVCSSNLATITTVYDNNNNPYNAFKYTSDGTDYYYVLDGTQTDWTDDLASIGYRLQQIYTAWVEANKSQGRVSSYLNSYMYNNSGSFYLYKYNTEYSIISIDGDRTSENIQKLELYNTRIADPYRLGLRVKAGIEGLVVNLTYIEFTMTPTT
jgi:phage tail P2-like protein